MGTLLFTGATAYSAFLLTTGAVANLTFESAILSLALMGDFISGLLYGGCLPL